MRYFLAIDAYLESAETPPAVRFEASIERWFASTERFARQLHEVDRDTYLDMKRHEFARQQATR
jgi:hypothetical protein